MLDPPPSPRAKRLAAPGWLDGRLVLGVLLVLVSVLVGARVLSSADRSQPVWTAARELAPGSVLQPDDLEQSQVRLFASARRYLSADAPKPVGYVLRRGIGRGELLPGEALTPPGLDVAVRLATVAVGRGHLPPDLSAGQQVDVYVTPEERRAVAAAPARPAAAPAGAGPRLVLQHVTVVRRASAAGLGAGSDTEPVVLQVRPDEVPQLLAAVAEGRIDLVRVPRYQEVAPSLSPASADR